MLSGRYAAFYPMLIKQFDGYRVAFVKSVQQSNRAHAGAIHG